MCLLVTNFALSKCLSDLESNKFFSVYFHNSPIVSGECLQCEKNNIQLFRNSSRAFYFRKKKSLIFLSHWRSKSGSLFCVVFLLNVLNTSGMISRSVYRFFSLRISQHLHFYPQTFSLKIILRIIREFILTFTGKSANFFQSHNICITIFKKDVNIQSTYIYIQMKTFVNCKWSKS